MFAGSQLDWTVSYIKKIYFTTTDDKETASIWIERTLDTIASYPDWSLAKGYQNVAYILASYIQDNHYLGSANLGNDCSSSVVSMDGVKVWGTDNLHIVNSSIHANVPSVNTQAITMVGAKKAVERLLQLRFLLEP